MFLFHDRPVSIMVLYAVALHLIWSIIILYDESATAATAVSALHRFAMRPAVLSAVLATAASMAFVGICTMRPWIVYLLIPQQIILMLSAYGAIDAIWLAQYADGVFRPRAFIAVDQIYSILAAIGHSAAIVIHAIRVNRL